MEGQSIMGIERPYASLHNHSDLSVQDGLSKPRELIETAMRKNIPAIAITDHGVMGGVAEFYATSEKNNFQVKHIFGVESYFVDSLDGWQKERERLDSAENIPEEELKILKKLNNSYSHLVLLAKNDVGLANLFELTFRGHKYGFYRKPRVDKAMLEKLSEGVIATSACIIGPLSNMLLRNYQIEKKVDLKSVEREIEWWSSIFKDRFFLELQFNEVPWQNLYNKILIKMARAKGIPLIVTTDSHYTERNHAKIHGMLKMINGNKLMSMADSEVSKVVDQFTVDSEDSEFTCNNLFIKSSAEIIESARMFSPEIDLKIVEEALDNTYQISKDIDLIKLDREIKIPTARNDVNEVISEEDCMKMLTRDALTELRKRNLHENKEYVDRLKTEIAVIKERKLATYFYIIYDIYKNNTSQLAGAGRGSCGGSLFLYLLGTTQLDPIRHEIMFERFLSPGRIELPDIDMDWEHPDLIKKYMKKKYGENNVFSVAAYGTFSYRNLLKDIGRIYGFPFSEMNEISAKVATEVQGVYYDFADQDKSTIQINYDILEEYSPTFVEFINRSEDMKEAFKILFGKIRSVGKHAAGCTVTEEIYRKLPVQSVAGDDERDIITSYTEGVASKTLSDFGFLKFDVLGLSTLRVLHHCYNLIARSENTTFEEVRERMLPSKIDLSDQKVYEHVFHNGNFCGIFQFTEKGIRTLAKQIKPDCFMDIAAICALYRPGPLGSGLHKEYAERKKNSDKIEYGHPIIENVLKATYGIITFQDSFMILCRDLGKFTWPEINAFRKSVVKRSKSADLEKIHKQWDEFKQKFVSNAVSQGCREDLANELWQNIMHHAGYSFNYSHSLLYSCTTYLTAYLATHYPAEFYASTLSYGGKDDFETAVKEIRNLKTIKILPPDINNSFEDFTIEDEVNVRVPFAKLKGMKTKAIEKILEQRKTALYTSFKDYLYRAEPSRSECEMLIQSGCFDSLEGKSSRKLLQEIYKLYNSSFQGTNEKGRKVKKKYSSDHEKFEEAINEMEFPGNYTDNELIEHENSLFGFTMFHDDWASNNNRENIDIIESKYHILKNKHEWFDVKVFKTLESFEESLDKRGYVYLKLTNFSIKQDKKKQDMAFTTFNDMQGAVLNTPIFATTYKNIDGILEKNIVYMVRLYKNDKGESMIGFPGWIQSKEMSTFSILPLEFVASL